MGRVSIMIHNIMTGRSSIIINYNKENKKEAGSLQKINTNQTNNTLHSNLTFYKCMSIAAHSILVTSNKQSTSDATKLKGRKLVTGEGCGQADICEATDRELLLFL